MGLIFELVRTVFKVTQLLRPAPTPSFWSAEDMAYDDIWAGADDLWPAEIAHTASEPELLVSQQYGLRLPSGDIVWQRWESPTLTIPFDNPLDRLRMVANLQRTATDLGFVIADFLDNYGWVTRNQIATVVYEDTGAYPLTDSVVCGVSAPVTGESSEHDSDSNHAEPVAQAHSAGDFRRGPVGGDAGAVP